MGGLGGGGRRQRWELVGVPRRRQVLSGTTISLACICDVPCSCSFFSLSDAGGLCCCTVCKIFRERRAVFQVVGGGRGIDDKVPYASVGSMRTYHGWAGDLTRCAVLPSVCACERRHATGDVISTALLLANYLWTAP